MTKGRGWTGCGPFLWRRDRQALGLDLGAAAQFERSIIKERQREGIAKAQAKGKHCGRTAKLKPEQVEEIKARIDAGEEKKALAQEYGVSRQTLYRAIG